MNRHSWHSWPGHGGCKGLEAGIGVLRDVAARPSRGVLPGLGGLVLSWRGWQDSAPPTPLPCNRPLLL